MNTKRKLMKWSGAAVLAVLTAVVLVSTIAAVPGIPLPVSRDFVDTPPVEMYSNSQTRFEQYMAASSPEVYEASFRLPTSSINSWARFEQYIAASEPQATQITSAIPSAFEDSWTRFQLYLEHSQ
ncbi:MAG: hypothetical protein ACK2UQ_00205 [Anaerolineae bacterium]|jgi:hypothetical protein